MNELIDFLTSKEATLVYIIAGLSCVVCFIVYIVEKNNDKRRRRHNTKELNKLVEQIKEVSPEVTEQEDAIIYDEPILENVTEACSVDEMLDITSNVELDNSSSYSTYNLEAKKQVNSIEELEYTSIEPDQETAINELKKIEEKLTLEEEYKNNNIEILESAETIDEPIIVEDKNIKLTDFEEGQEAEAIISLDELLSKGKELYDMNEVAQYEDEGNEPISIQDLQARMEKNTVTDEVVSKDEERNETQFIETVEGFDKVVSVGDIKIQPKFKSSPIISPIFGIEGINNESVNELELENTANYEKLDQEIKKTNEFLMTLKELQNKLE